MTATEIQTEIAELTETVRYSPGAQANIAATKICSLKRKLAELTQKEESN